MLTWCSVWDMRSLKQVQTVEVGSAITSVEASLDGKHLTVTAAKDIIFYDLATYCLQHQLRLTPTQAQQGQVIHTGLRVTLGITGT